MSDDLISRQAAIDELEERVYANRCSTAVVSELNRSIGYILHLPSAQRWIPVSEKLPKNDDWVIVTILDERGDTPFKYTDFGWYLEEANCWVIGAEQRKDVTAWMPLPGPYKEDKNDADVC